MKPWPPDVAPEPDNSPIRGAKRLFRRYGLVKIFGKLADLIGDNGESRPCSPALAASIEAFRNSEVYPFKKIVNYSRDASYVIRIREIFVDIVKRAGRTPSASGHCVDDEFLLQILTKDLQRINRL